MHRRLGEHQSRYGHSGEEKNLWPPPGIKSHPARPSIPTAVSAPVTLSESSSLFYNTFLNMLSILDLMTKIRLPQIQLNEKNVYNTERQPTF
jgi:hypothetical protein